MKKKTVCALVALFMLFAAMLSFAEEAAVYREEGLGVCFTAPENWKIFTNEEMAAELGMDASYYDEENLAAMLKQGLSVSVMLAENELTGSTVELVRQDLTSANAAALKAVGEEKLLEHEADEIIAQYEDMGYTISDPGFGKLKLAGTERPYFMYYFTVPGRGTQVLVVETKAISGDSLYTLTLSSATDGDIAAALSAFEGI